MATTYTFEYFRYQLVPKRVTQLTIDNVPFEYEEIKARKNEFFADVLEKAKYRGHKGNLPYKMIYNQESLYLMWLSNIRTTSIYQDFKEEKIITEPS